MEYGCSWVKQVRPEARCSLGKRCGGAAGCGVQGPVGPYRFSASWAGRAPAQTLATELLNPSLPSQDKKDTFPCKIPVAAPVAEHFSPSLYFLAAYGAPAWL